MTIRPILRSIMGQRLSKTCIRAVYLDAPADDNTGYVCRPFDPIEIDWRPGVFVESKDLFELPRGNPVLRAALDARYQLRRRLVPS